MFSTNDTKTIMLNFDNQIKVVNDYIYLVGAAYGSTSKTLTNIYAEENDGKATDYTKESTLGI